VNSLPSNNVVANLMDIDDDLYGNSTTNGFSNHGTVSHPSTTNQISNGHSLLDDDDDNKNTNSNGCSKTTTTTEILDGMEYDGNGDSTRITDMETTLSDGQKEDDQLLVRVLQFGRELHALKQQLNTEYGENTQNDKILQVYFHKLHIEKSTRNSHDICNINRHERNQSSLVPVSVRNKFWCRSRVRRGCPDPYFFPEPGPNPDFFPDGAGSGRVSLLKAGLGLRNPEEIL
jgi:hypothetical protein